jgi:hypothetical protein
MSKRKVVITIIINLVFAVAFMGCNDNNSSSSWTGANISSDNHLVVYNISGDNDEIVLNEEGPITLTVTPKWATVLVVEDGVEVESSKLFSAWEISPGQEGELYTLIRSYWGLSSDWMPNLDPTSLRQIEDLEILLEALICSGSEVPSEQLEEYMDLQCPDFFIPQSLFREIASDKTSFSLDYLGERLIFIFYE